MIVTVEELATKRKVLVISDGTKIKVHDLGVNPGFADSVRTLVRNPEMADENLELLSGVAVVSKERSLRDVLPRKEHSIKSPWVQAVADSVISSRFKQETVDFKAASWLATQELASHNFAVKRGAVYDPGVRRFRCPPGTRYGGRITNRFGSNCGGNVVQRIATGIGRAARRVDDELDELGRRRASRLESRARSRLVRRNPVARAGQRAQRAALAAQEDFNKIHDELAAAIGRIRDYLHPNGREAKKNPGIRKRFAGYMANLYSRLADAIDPDLPKKDRTRAARTAKKGRRDIQNATRNDKGSFWRRFLATIEEKLADLIDPDRPRVARRNERQDSPPTARRPRRRETPEAEVPVEEEEVLEAPKPPRRQPRQDRNKRPLNGVITERLRREAEEAEQRPQRALEVAENWIDGNPNGRSDEEGMRRAQELINRLQRDVVENRDASRAEWEDANKLIRKLQGPDFLNTHDERGNPRNESRTNRDVSTEAPVEADQPETPESADDSTQDSIPRLLDDDGRIRAILDDVNDRMAHEDLLDREVRNTLMRDLNALEIPDGPAYDTVRAERALMRAQLIGMQDRDSGIARLLGTNEARTNDQVPVNSDQVRADAGLAPRRRVQRLFDPQNLSPRRKRQVLSAAREAIERNELEFRRRLGLAPDDQIFREDVDDYIERQRARHGNNRAYMARLRAMRDDVFNFRGARDEDSRLEAAANFRARQGRKAVKDAMDAESMLSEEVRSSLPEKVAEELDLLQDYESRVINASTPDEMQQAIDELVEAVAKFDENEYRAPHVAYNRIQGIFRVLSEYGEDRPNFARLEEDILDERRIWSDRAFVLRQLDQIRGLNDWELAELNEAVGRAADAEALGVLHDRLSQNPSKAREIALAMYHRPVEARHLAAAKPDPSWEQRYRAVFNNTAQRELADAMNSNDPDVAEAALEKISEMIRLRNELASHGLRLRIALADKINDELSNPSDSYDAIFDAYKALDLNQSHLKNMDDQIGAIHERGQAIIRLRGVRPIIGGADPERTDVLGRVWNARDRALDAIEEAVHSPTFLLNDVTDILDRGDVRELENQLATIETDAAARLNAVADVLYGDDGLDKQLVNLIARHRAGEVSTEEVLPLLHRWAALDAMSQTAVRQLRSVNIARARLRRRQQQRRAIPALQGTPTPAETSSSVRTPASAGTPSLAGTQDVIKELEDLIAKNKSKRAKALKEYLKVKYPDGQTPWKDSANSVEQLRTWSLDGNHYELERWAKQVFQHDSIDIGEGRTVRTQVVGVSSNGGSFRVEGLIFGTKEDDQGISREVQIGSFSRSIRPETRSVYNATLFVNNNDFKGGGFSQIFNNHAFLYYKEAGFHTVSVSAAQDGKVIWGRAGFRDEMAIRRLVPAFQRQLDAYEAGNASIIRNDLQARLIRELLRDPNRAHIDYHLALEVGENRAARDEVFNFFAANAPFGSGEMDLAEIDFALRVERLPVQGGIRRRLAEDDGFGFIRDANNQLRFRTVPNGNAGIDIGDQAIEWVDNGGDLNEVPDSFVEHAINNSSRFTVTPLNNGMNSTKMVLDTLTGRRYILKRPRYFRHEPVAEILFAGVFEELGVPAARVRLAGSWTPGRDAFGHQLRYRPILIEHVGDLYEGDGDFLDAETRGHYGRIGALGAPIQGEGWNNPDGSVNDNAVVIAVLDGVLDNRDRHFRNYFLDDSGRVIPIDNGGIRSWFRDNEPPRLATHNIERELDALSPTQQRIIAERFANLQHERIKDLLEEAKDAALPQGTVAMTRIDEVEERMRRLIEWSRNWTRRRP